MKFWLKTDLDLKAEISSVRFCFGIIIARAHIMPILWKRGTKVVIIQSCCTPRVYEVSPTKNAGVEDPLFQVLGSMLNAKCYPKCYPAFLSVWERESGRLLLWHSRDCKRKCLKSSFLVIFFMQYTCSVDSRASHGNNDPSKPHNGTSSEKRVQAMWGIKFLRIRFEHSCDIGSHWGGSEEIWVFVMWENSISRPNIQPLLVSFSAIYARRFCHKLGLLQSIWRRFMKNQKFTDVLYVTTLLLESLPYKFTLMLHITISSLSVHGAQRKLHTNQL